MRPRSTTAVNVQPIPLNLLSRRPCEKIQLLRALRTVAPARPTSMVSGRSQKPSRNPRTALGAADAIGNGGDDVAARPGQFHAENGAGEVLVALARAGLGGKAHARSNRWRYFRHERRSRGAAEVERPRMMIDGLDTVDAVLIVQLAAIIKEIAAGA